MIGVLLGVVVGLLVAGAAAYGGWWARGRYRERTEFEVHIELPIQSVHPKNGAEALEALQRGMEKARDLRQRRRIKRGS